MNDYETIQVDLSERVATVTLNRPDSLNAISQTMRNELFSALTALEAKPEIRVIILAAAGKGFCSGTDLSEGLAGYTTIHDQIQKEYRPVFTTISKSEKIYIAAAKGACVGIGAGLAMTCDLTVMSEDAFLYLAFAGLSLVPDGGMSHYLVNAMGYKKAFETFIECGRITAQDCLRYNLVNKVVANDELEKTCRNWAQALSQGAPIAQRLGKEIMRSVHTSSYQETFDQESIRQAECSSSKDHMAAIDAFFKKTTPIFTGE